MKRENTDKMSEKALSKTLDLFEEYIQTFFWLYHYKVTTLFHKLI